MICPRAVWLRLENLPVVCLCGQIRPAPLTPGCNRAYQWSNSVSADALLFVPLAIRPAQRTSSGALMGVVNSDTDIWTHWTLTGLAQTRTHALPWGYFHEQNWKIQSIDFFSPPLPHCVKCNCHVCFINAELISLPWGSLSVFNLRFRTLNLAVLLLFFFLLCDMELKLCQRASIHGAGHVKEESYQDLAITVHNQNCNPATMCKIMKG